MFFDVGVFFGPVSIRESTFSGFEGSKMDCGVRSVWWYGWEGVVGLDLTEKWVKPGGVFGGEFSVFLGWFCGEFGEISVPKCISG